MESHLKVNLRKKKLAAKNKPEKIQKNNEEKTKSSIKKQSPKKRAIEKE